jgi:hypothetical protein
MQLKDDPAIAEIRATRHKISEEFGHDPQRVINHYIQLQQQQEQLRQSQKQIVEAQALESSKA